MTEKRKYQANIPTTFDEGSHGDFISKFWGIHPSKGCENIPSVVDHQYIRVSSIPTKRGYKITLSFNDFSL
jgi:hypothetical protein